MSAVSNKTDLDAPTIDAIATLGQEAAGGLSLLSIAAPEDLAGLPKTISVAVRSGAKPELLDLRKLFEPWRTAPERIKGKAVATTLASFIDLVNRHKSDNSAIFAQTRWPEPKLTAVLNYNTLDHQAAWGDHRVTYAFPLTDEFKVWIEGDRTPMEQAEFACFLEDHAAELAAPYDAEKLEYETLFKLRCATPTELIRLSRDLEVTATARVKRAERLQSGERTVQFIEEHTNADGETIDIPGLFVIAVRAFVDGEPVRIPARLSYRIKGGTIVWAYSLYRWDYWLRIQVQADLARAAKDTGLPAFEGEPEG